MKKVVLLVGISLLMGACSNVRKQVDKDDLKSTESSESQQPAFPVKEGDVVAGINLTVAEGKRLIAKGIANMPAVKEKLNKGIVVITSGTTNTYIAEELAGLKAPRGSFLTGNIVPQGAKSPNSGLERVSNITLIDGKVSDINYEEAFGQMQEGDIVFKGANLLNYERKQAAVCIGAPDGGTTTRVRTVAGEGKARLIVPIGLEKEVYGDLNEYEAFFANQIEQLSYVPKVWVHQDAEIFTEIEAIRTFAEVNVLPWAAGGIAGREGGISLAVYGAKPEVQKILDLIASIQGEKSFVEPHNF